MSSAIDARCEHQQRGIRLRKVKWYLVANYENKNKKDHSGTAA
jgi:hypothetical protein